ncbi:MAG: hypothetical protein SFU86_10505 [Pirellulaceae bacterium]|nr:hypothetical protein [Pirellulaceae bacterium]
MNRTVAFGQLLLLLGIMLSGCEQPRPAANAGVGGAPPPPPPVVPAAPPPPVVAPTEEVKADVGVGIKGRSLDGESGLIVEPAKQYFALKERIVFQIQIPDGMNKFKALEGRAPSSHDEFMQRIIQEGQIKLPMLPAGHEYVYQPETEELHVRRPKPPTP